MIKITSRRHGFRRCGMPHYKEPVTYPDDRFSEQELKILKAEPMLIVEVLENGDTELETRIAEVEKRIKDEVSADEKGAEEEIEPEKNELLEAARSAIAAGKVTREDKPLVEAMEEILGRDITAAERDAAWEKLCKGV